MRTPDRAAVFVVPGFGDSSRSWRALLEAPLAARHAVRIVDLPGVGAPAAGTPHLLASMADHVASVIGTSGSAHEAVVVGHSLGSAVAVEAIRVLDGAVLGLLSLEGNLTTEDGYFSSTAADHEDADAFRAALLERIDEFVRTGAAPASYRTSIEDADPVALWELGRDAAQLGAGDRFGEAFVTAPVPTRYLWSARSTPAASQRFLVEHDIDHRRNDDATHWPLENARPWLLDEVERFIQTHVRP